MKFSRLVFISLLVTCFGLLAQAASADEAFNDPPKRVLQVMPEAHRMGTGNFRWWSLRVYDAQMWSNADPRTFDYKNDASWVELKYARNFTGKDIAQRSIKEIQQLNIASAEELKNWETELIRIFPDVQKGHTLSMLYLPGKGLEFFRNGAPMAKIEDIELSTAFLGIWLDPKTSAPEMRKQLIGQSKN